METVTCFEVWLISTWLSELQCLVLKFPCVWFQILDHLGLNFNVQTKAKSTCDSDKQNHAYIYTNVHQIINANQIFTILNPIYPIASFYSSKPSWQTSRAPNNNFEVSYKHGLPYKKSFHILIVHIHHLVHIKYTTI